MSDEKSPLERLLDTFVYAPIGLLLSLDEVVPQLVEKGHQQVNMARMFGQFVVEGEGKKQVQKLQAQARAAVGNVAEQAAGIVAGAAGRLPSGGSSSSSPAPAPAVDTEPAPAGDGAAPAEPSPEHDALAIPDYDSLSASQVVPRLEGLSDDELDGVRRYEAAHRGRKTILSKITQLTA